MDGFEPSDGVILLAATNRPDALDPALRRPGRFDREVLVPLPGRADRQAILAVYARGKNLEPDVDLGQVAAATPGFAGDLASATALAVQMVREFGLSTALGPVSYAEAQTWPLSGPGAPRGYSEHTQWLIDREVATLLTRAEARARELLTEHMQALQQLTTALVERETITGDQVRALVRAASPVATSADRKISPNPFSS
jgi:ATP-dependent Zn protease